MRWGVAMGALGVGSVVVAQPTLEWLEFRSGLMSADGRAVVVGIAPPEGQVLLRWTRSLGVERVTPPPMVAGLGTAVFTGISGDGAAIVLHATNSPAGLSRTWRWDEGSGWTELVIGQRTQAHHLSADGRVILGQAHRTPGDPQSFRVGWNGVEWGIRGLALSADGGVVLESWRRLLRSGVFQVLESPVSGSGTGSANALALTPSGSIAAGWASWPPTTGNPAWRETPAYWDGLGALHEMQACCGATTARVNAVSAGGAVGVGHMIVNGAREALIWADGLNGPAMRLADYLRGRGLDTRGFEFFDALRVSDDGLVILGEGRRLIAGGLVWFAWRADLRRCTSDLDLDGTADFNDLLLFLNWYNEGNWRADLDYDGIVDFNDFLVLLQGLAGGC